MTEKAAFYLGKREDADDLSATLGDAVMRAMAKDVLDDFAPPDAMKEARFSGRLDIRFPPLGVCGLERADDRTFHHGPLGGRWHHCGIHQVAPLRKTRSTRSQRKSDTNRRNLGSVRFRLT